MLTAWPGFRPSTANEFPTSSTTTWVRPSDATWNSPKRSFRTRTSNESSLTSAHSGVWHMMGARSQQTSLSGSSWTLPPWKIASLPRASSSPQHIAKWSGPRSRLPPGPLTMSVCPLAFCKMGRCRGHPLLDGISTSNDTCQTIKGASKLRIGPILNGEPRINFAIKLRFGQPTSTRVPDAPAAVCGSGMMGGATIRHGKHRQAGLRRPRDFGPGLERLSGRNSVLCL
jgi:hypothetical protein